MKLEIGTVALTKNLRPYTGQYSSGAKVFKSKALAESAVKRSTTSPYTFHSCFVELEGVKMRDEVTNKEILDKAELVTEQYYIGRCRNACIARWDGTKFIHWRIKFKNIFLETIKHPEDEKTFDVFWPLRLLPNPKIVIPFDPANAYIRADFVFNGDPDDLIEYNAEVWGS